MRELNFNCGTLRVEGAYYVCMACGQTSYPLDERLGVVEGKEQGRLREKLALLAVRRVFLEQSWQAYWNSHGQLAA